ncbi:hypothetical protein FRB90_005208 [Tulasnella sp. 427]|nr:hypothetical protein FRB90_005208 [Tulasnella sp. 427]
MHQTSAAEQSNAVSDGGAALESDRVVMGPIEHPLPYVQPGEPRQPRPSGWTYHRDHRTEEPLIGKTISLGLPAFRVETYGMVKDVGVEEEWMDRLQPDKWFPGCLVDLYLSEVVNAYFEAGGLDRVQELCLLPTSLFYCVASSQGRYAPQAFQDKWESALEHSFVAFPMNAHSNHWLLGIITHASDLLAEVNPNGPVRSAVLVLNSINGHHPSAHQTRIRQMINMLAIGKPLHQTAVKRLPFFYPPVIQQPNVVDCGLYPGHFLSVFLTDPAKFVEHWDEENERDRRPSLEGIAIAYCATTSSRASGINCRRAQGG